MKKTVKLKKGSIVVFNPVKDRMSSARKGFLAEVVGYDLVRYSSKKEILWLDVKWLTKTSQADGGYFKEDFKLATPEQVALLKLRA